MLEKETAKLEDGLTFMVRITKENEEIDKSREIEKIKTQAKQEVQNLEEIKNTISYNQHHRLIGMFPFLLFSFFTKILFLPTS